MAKNYAITAARYPNAYKVVIAMHASRMKERYRQERLRALGEEDDNPFEERAVYNEILRQMYINERRYTQP